MEAVALREIVVDGRRQIAHEVAELRVIDGVANIGIGNAVAACRYAGLRHVKEYAPGRLTQTKRDAESISERATRIELAFSAWEADVLPLNYARDSGETSK